MPEHSPPRQHIFIHLQTTGLDFTRDHITEVAWVTSGDEKQFFTHHDARLVSPWVRDNTNYVAAQREVERVPLATALRALAADCYGPSCDQMAYIVGSNVAFTDRFLRVAYLNLFLREPPYHYRLIDIETYAAGAHGVAYPKAAGVSPSMRSIERAKLIATGFEAYSKKFEHALA